MQTSYSVKSFMDRNFENIITYCSKFQQQPSKNMFVGAGLKIQKYFASKCEIDDLFSRPKEESIIATNKEDFVILHQIEYAHIFLIMYLSYFNKLVTNQLNENFGNDWSEEKIGYIISVEKLLLDTVVGSKESLQELLFESGVCRRKIIVENVEL